MQTLSLKFKGNFVKNIGFAVVFFGALSECAWVYGLKFATTPTQYALTILATLVSTYLLITSFKFLATSLAYVLYVGLGTGFVVLSEILATHEFDFARIFFILTLLVGIFGLKRIKV